jgi:hypothetical protein
MLTRIALLLMLISALVASVPGAAQSPARLAGASEREAMGTGVQVPLVMMDLSMRRSTNVSRPLGIGAFGIDYDARAFIALNPFGENPPADSLYPTSFVDGEDKPLNRANRATLHFAAGWTPPVNVFWSAKTSGLQSSRTIQSSVARSAFGCLSIATAMAYLTFTSDMIRRTRRKKRTGFPLPTAGAGSPCACTGRRMRSHRSSTEAGRPQRWFDTD